MYHSGNNGESSSNWGICKIATVLFQNIAFMKKRPSNPVLPYCALFRSEDDQIWPLTLHLELSKAIRVQWHWLTLYIYLQCPIWRFSGFIEVLRPNTWLLFYIDMFLVPLYTIRCQSGSLTQFALRRFCRWWWRCTLPGHCASHIFHPETVTTRYIVQNWTGNTLVKTVCRYDQ